MERHALPSIYMSEKMPKSYTIKEEKTKKIHKALKHNPQNN